MMYNNALSNVKTRLEKGRVLTIGYFGGSITEGAGASNPDETSWRGLTTKWFRDSYPLSGIIEIQAAIGGTASDLGAFRCKADLLTYNPDLVFVEFAVNDNEKPAEDILRYMEGIVRQIYDYNINTDIIFIYTTTKMMSDSYILGNEPYTITVHEKIAKHYDIPSINVGKVLWDNINGSIRGWDEYAPDSVHPSDKGYIIYANEVIKYLSSVLSEPSDISLRTLPMPLSSEPAEYANLDYAWDSYQKGWEKEELTLYGKKYNLLTCDTPETSLVYKFNGTGIGLYWIIACDSGDIEWSIDDGIRNNTSSWDKYALDFNRANYCILDSNLESGEHKLEIKILDEKNPDSKGTYIRMIGFLVENKQQGKS